MVRLFEGTKWDIPPRCDRCSELEEDCQCPPEPPPAPELISPQKQTARLAVGVVLKVGRRAAFRDDRGEVAPLIPHVIIHVILAV